MSIQFTCPHCSRPHKVDDKYAGKRIACKKCGQPIRVPLPASASRAPSPAKQSAAAAPVHPPAPIPTIHAICPHCGRPHNVEIRHAGKLIRCKKCEQPFRVPQSSHASPAPAPIPQPVAHHPPAPEPPPALPTEPTAAAPILPSPSPEPSETAPEFLPPPTLEIPSHAIALDEPPPPPPEPESPPLSETTSEPEAEPELESPSPTAHLKLPANIEPPPAPELEPIASLSEPPTPSVPPAPLPLAETLAPELPALADELPPPPVELESPPPLRTTAEPEAELESLQPPPHLEIPTPIEPQPPAPELEAAPSMSEPPSPLVPPAPHTLAETPAPEHPAAAPEPFAEPTLEIPPPTAIADQSPPSPSEPESPPLSEPEPELEPLSPAPHLEIPTHIEPPPPAPEIEPAPSISEPASPPQSAPPREDSNPSPAIFLELPPLAPPPEPELLAPPMPELPPFPAAEILALEEALPLPERAPELPTLEPESPETFTPPAPPLETILSEPSPTLPDQAYAPPPDILPSTPEPPPAPEPEPLDSPTNESPSPEPPQSPVEEPPPPAEPDDYTATIFTPPTPQETSEAGSPIYRHTPRPGPSAVAPPLTPYLAHITSHIQRTIGPAPIVFHEIISIGIHIELHVVPPSTDPPSPIHPRGNAHFTIITSGLSSRPMNIPPGSGIPALAELMICLPVDWPGMKLDGTFDTRLMRDEANWWPLRWLKAVARMPYEYNTFLGPGHTIPNTASALPFSPHTNLGCMLVQPSLLNPRASRLPVSPNLAIQFYALWPLYPEEMHLKQTLGVDALLHRFKTTGTSELIQLNRKNVAPPPPKPRPVGW